MLHLKESPFRPDPASMTEVDEDVALVVAAKNGDRPAFGRLHERFAPMVHAILMARVPPRIVADLVQDVFLQALEKLGGLRDLGAFGPWLAMIARNRATDFIRRRHPETELPPDVCAADDRAVEAHEALAAIRSLPDAYRETLLMRLVEGMSGPEIAARTGLTPGSVRVNLHRGMTLLRERLAGKSAHGR